MSYVVLARKWRPTRFEDLVGQEHVARTLANAIASGRIAHAFLFTGVRGVGKTTSARLLARSLNCMGGAQREPGQADPGPTATPCLECPACREITQGSDVDVREIDGASHNGVDEVRKLQDSLPYRPARDRYKIFIIDEVHMLSSGAWNAFLKTLEEPPPHVKFIFATTEVHKVPVTILSRVQRFDFKLIPTRLIVDRLRFVLNAENIAAEEAGLAIIARQAAGSMRDAMSLLDQVIAWNDQKLDGESVARVLGVASRKILHVLAASVVEGKTRESLDVIDQVSQQGFDLAHVARDFLELLRDLVVAKVCGDPAGLLDLPDEEQRDVTGLAQRANPDDLLRLYHGFSAGFDDVLRSAHPRGALEMLLVRLCRRPPLLPLDDLVMRLASLERRLGSGPAAPPNRPPQPIGSVGPSLQPRVQSREARSSPPRKGEPSADDSSEDPAPGQASPAAEKRPEPTRAPYVSAPEPGTPPPKAMGANRTDESESVNAPAKSGTAKSKSAAATHQPAPNQPASNQPAPNQPAPNQPAPNQLPRNHTAKNRSLPNPTIPSDVPGSTVLDETELMALWQDLVERVMATRPDVAAVLEHALLLEANLDRLVVGWPPNSVFCSQFDDAQLAELIGTAQLEHSGKSAMVSIARNDPRATGRDTLASRETAERTMRYRQDQARIRNHPRVRDAVEILGGRVLAVKLADH